ncbi:MAG: hypothetical protein IJX81_04835 [Clostridia bacterium]|nr:hypothetical protein [Clostridia bacterium]
MLCCKCKKNQATKTFVSGSGAKRKEEYYCFECYRERFLSVEYDGEENGRSFEVCPYCGVKAEEFRRSGLVGCAKCYKTIGKAVLPALIGMQGAVVHVGKEGAATEEEHVNLRLIELKLLYEAYRGEGNTERARAVAEEYARTQDGLFVGGKSGALT